MAVMLSAAAQRGSAASASGKNACATLRDAGSAFPNRPG